jgi:type IV pilus assembly protein PilF
MKQRLVTCSTLLLVILAIVACAGNTVQHPREAEEPMSQKQTSAGDVQRRAKVHTELGALYLGDGRLATALEEARAAIAADSGYAPAYNLLGLVHMYLRENVLAEENFEHALRLAPDDAEISNNFGWFLCQSNQQKRSISYFQAAIRNPLYATPAKPLVNAGICSLQVKDDAAAEDFLSRALRMDNSNTTALYWLADVQYRHSHLGEARARIDALHHLSEPNAASAWLALRIAHKIGDRDAEARYSSQMRRKFSDSDEYQKMMRGQYE